MSRGSFASESLNAWAVPLYDPVIVVGTPALPSASLITLTASPSATPGARLKERVTEGNTPEWFTDRGAVAARKWVKAARGTMPPPAEETYTFFSASGLCQ